MIGFCTINGLDVYSTYGISFRPGTYAELLKAPKRKKGYEKDWDDENGIETDPQEGPRFERQTYNLPIFIQANNAVQFYSRFNAFKAFLYTSGEFHLDMLEMERRFKVRYWDMTSFDKLTLIKNSSKVGCYFTLQLTDDHPVDNFPII